MPHACASMPTRRLSSASITEEPIPAALTHKFFNSGSIVESLKSIFWPPARGITCRFK